MIFNRHAVSGLRKSQGMTQQALADAAGTVVPYISQLESGKRSTPGPKILDGLCKALGVEDERVFYVEPTLDDLIAEFPKAKARDAA